MKELAFYPGCALHSMSWDYRESIRQAVKALEVDLEEMEDWTCCGATAVHSLDEHLSIVLAGRNLARVQTLGRDLAVACPMCFKRLNTSRQALLEQRVDDPWSLSPDLAIVDLARVLTSETMLPQIKEKVSVPLRDLKVVCYYGCQVVRHPKVTKYPAWEDPQHLDRLVTALGATPLDWSYKAVCCGASLGIPKREIGLSLINRLLNQARATGAQAVVVCCPLCQSNLDLFQSQLESHTGSGVEGPEKEAPLPILYYTELINIALGRNSARAVRRLLKGHVVDPWPLVGRYSVH